MKCPACGNSLQQITIEDITVNLCKGGCGGIWFDNFELKKFDEQHESAGQALLDIERDGSVVVDRSKRLKCPKCNDVVMMRHFFSIKKSVEVDECPACGGYWLDAGELAAIHSLFETEADRHKAAEEYFENLFGEHFKARKAENEKKLARTQNTFKIFKYICPSNYIPGKQDWGAF
ncbi:MAG: zf-TFIIB domain-containing protein [Phycisphaerae bacterium]|nr:zf-TFIIB domain-containing protein [Phycisphaerae bacterium]